MADYITEVAVSLNETEESQLREKNFILVPGDLNEGAGGDVIRLWFKRENTQAITRIQFSFTDDMAKGLSEAGYSKIDKNLNSGAGGAAIYLWYYQGAKKCDVPIEDFHISTHVEDEAAVARSGWEKRACDLNKGAGGNDVFLWMKRAKQVYICDVKVTSGYESDAFLFGQGYIRMDQNTNEYRGTAPVFIWYCLSLEKRESIKDLQISTNIEEYINLQKRGYTVVNNNLDPENGSRQVLLWFVKNGFDPIKGLTYITSNARDAFRRIGAIVLDPSMHSWWGGYALYLCFSR